MNKSLPATEHYDTFDRSLAHWSVTTVQGMKSFYTYSTADCGRLAGDLPTLEANLQRCAYDVMQGYGCLTQFLENAKRDATYRLHQPINFLIFATELAFFVFWKKY